jgi:hypothetical protein
VYETETKQYQFFPFKHHQLLVSRAAAGHNGIRRFY